MHAFLGSQADAGIGEDFLPATVTASVPTSSFPCFPIPERFDIVQVTPAMGGAGEFLDTQIGVREGYGCCLLFSFDTNPGFPLTQLPGMPVILVGIPTIGSSFIVRDFGAAPTNGFAVECKEVQLFIPSAITSGTPLYFQMVVYPTNFQIGDLIYSSNLVTHIAM